MDEPKIKDLTEREQQIARKSYVAGFEAGEIIGINDLPDNYEGDTFQFFEDQSEIFINAILDPQSGLHL